MMFCYRSRRFQLLLLRHWHKYFSQGGVAIRLRCGGIFSDNIIKLSPNSGSEKVWKLVNIWWSYKAYKVPPFLEGGHPVVTSICYRGGDQPHARQCCCADWRRRVESISVVSRRGQWTAVRNSPQTRRRRHTRPSDSHRSVAAAARCAGRMPRRRQTQARNDTSTTDRNCKPWRPCAWGLPSRARRRTPARGSLWRQSQKLKKAFSELHCLFPFPVRFAAFVSNSVWDTKTPRIEFGAF